MQQLCQAVAMTSESGTGAMEDDLGMALDHAWAWFSLHAGQRMQLVNFLLISAAFVVAGYATALRNGTQVAAGAIAVAGVVVALGFWRLDVRTRELVRAAEAPLRELQHELATRTGITSLRLVDAVAVTGPLTSYASVLRVLCASCGMLAALGALYGFFVFD